YPSILSAAQIDYMLPRLYAPAVLARELAQGIHYEVLDDVAFASWEAAGDGARLHKLYVHPDHQRAGHGRRLIEHVAALSRAAGCTRLTLKVNKHNASAIAFYRRCGFRVADAVVVDIGGGFVMDDYVMERSHADL